MKTPSRSKTSTKPAIVDLPEAAELVHVAPMWLFKMLKNGELPGALKVEGVWRVDLAELKRVLKANPKRAE